MYSIDDPAGGKPHSGGAVQILGPIEDYVYRTLPNVAGFWAAYDRLAFEHCQGVRLRQAQPNQQPGWLPHPAEGYRVTATLNQGQIKDPVTGVWTRWHYETVPVYGWGNPTEPQQPTAGWLSFLPVFDPGWQVLMAHGLSTGWIEWQGQRYEFANAPAYAEKNWGSSFPVKWFWIQCNAFDGAPDLALTAVGGLRNVLSRQEKVGMIAVHYRGQFYPFVSTHDPLTWQVQPWGQWQMSAHHGPYRAELTGTTSDPGELVRVPTREGLQFRCRDTTHGQLQIQLFEQDRPILTATSSLAGLEVGGGPWQQPWQKS